MVCSSQRPAVDGTVQLNFNSDYNFEPAKDGSCKLVSGLEPPDHSRVCKEDPEKMSYFLPTGYRRIPLSTCEGGNELEKYESKEVPCRGHEEDFENAHRGLSGFWIFILAVVLPIGIASAVGYWVWQNWDGKFGRIRLGDQGSAFDAERPWIKYPIAAVSGVVAVLAAVPLLVGSLWRWISGMFSGGRRYTTRGSLREGEGTMRLWMRMSCWGRMMTRKCRSTGSAWLYGLAFP